MEDTLALTTDNVLRNDIITCRICLVRGDGMQELFVEGIGIIEQIEYCTGIRLLNEPTLPCHICCPCLANLSIAYSFKSTCLASHHTLHPHAQTLVDTRPAVMVKMERDDSTDMDNEEWVQEERKSKRIKMKKEKEDSPEPPDIKAEKVYKRGPYKKSGDRRPKSCTTEPPDIKPEKVYKRGPYKKSGARRPKSCTTEPPDIKPEKVYKRGPYKKDKSGIRRPKFKFRRLWCTVCQLKFESKEESDAHRLANHPEDSWMCEICGKVFTHRGSHYTHVRSHLPPLHGCAHCDYKTWHRHDLVKHLRIHGDIKQYQCTQCARTFRTSSNLASHTKRLHERARPYQCTQCSRRFFDRTKLRRHIDSHNDIKRFECEVCHSCFTRRCYWKKHLQKQHGVTIPPQRPGRQKVNFLVGEELMQDSTLAK